jgi:hypothetical protein
VTPKEFHDAGSVVAVEARYTGTYKQTGKSLDAQVCHVWRIRDGKVTSFRRPVRGRLDYLRRTRLEGQLGRLP